MTFNCIRWRGLGSGVQRLGDEYPYPLVTTVLGHPWARCSTHKPPFPGYIIPLLHCGMPVLGKARGVYANRKSGAGVPKAVWQNNATSGTYAMLLVPKLYRHSSFPWTHRPGEKGGLAVCTTARLPYTLSRLCSSTGDNTPGLLHRLMQTEGCRRNKIHFRRSPKLDFV